MKIHVHIERLILDGLPLGPGGGGRVQAAVEAELALLLDGGLAGEFRGGVALPHVQADPIQAASTNPNHLGQQIARSVYGGIGNAK
jgi:hypothetical protein